MDNLKDLGAEAIALVNEAETIKDLDNVRVDYLGKKGKISALMKELGKLSAEERPAAGAKINEVKQEKNLNMQFKDNLNGSFFLPA